MDKQTQRANEIEPKKLPEALAVKANGSKLEIIPEHREIQLEPKKYDVKRRQTFIVKKWNKCQERPWWKSILWLYHSFWQSRAIDKYNSCHKFHANF